MSLTFQAERWPTVRDEVIPLAQIHWEEVEKRDDGLVFELDLEMYEVFHANGILYFSTVRDNGRLVGYFSNIVGRHHHYRGVLFACLDAYFLLPEYRKVWTGVKMFRHMEQQMRDIGVRKMTGTVTRLVDTSAVFRYLRWVPVETTYSKVLIGSLAGKAV